MKYIQGPVSIEFKQVVKQMVQSAKTEQELDAVLNHLHDCGRVIKSHTK
ncbi:hypothetical protein [Pseudoalteromonas galatheae]